MFSQNLENEKNLVCVLGRAERMPRETATAKHLGRMRALGSSSPALRLQTRNKGSETTYPGARPNPPGCSNGGKDDGICHLTAMT